jgi:glycosyltransferase involved in cell wall biosynthesis
MRRVLIVTSSYAPTMIADMQRARQLAWELPKLGWEVEVLSPSTEYQPATCIDDDSAEFFSPRSHVHRVPVMWRDIFRIAGVGSIGWCALLPMWFAGSRLLQQRHFDLLYISTAHSPLFLLGSIWQRRFGVPFVLDLHDPLYKENSRHPVWAQPRLKHRISNVLAKQLEAHVATAAQGLVAVSPNYIDTLRRRHEAKKPAWLRPGRSDVIPFSARLGDLCEGAQGIAPEAEKKGPPYGIVYVGVGGPVMTKSFTLFSRVLSQLRTRFSELCNGIRIELYGTMLGWKPGEPRDLADIAAKWGIDDLVREEPGRVSYRHSIELLLQSDGALIFGVEDPGYMPSKLFSYALSGKPLLATLHREGPAFAHFQRISDLGHALWIGQNEDMPLEDAMNVLEAFLREVVTRQVFDRRTKVMPYLAPAMARRHVELFEACL